MSDVVKWGLLVAGIVIIITAILALPFVSIIDVTTLNQAVVTLLTVADSAMRFGRSTVNLFFSPAARNYLDIIIPYLFFRPLLLYGIKILVWIYHYIFK